MTADRAEGREGRLVVMSAPDDPEMRETWTHGERTADRIEAEIADLKTERGKVEATLAQLELLWLRSHRCSCGLIGMPNCQHGTDGGAS